jgi:cyclohexadienyl dehydratase
LLCPLLVVALATGAHPGELRVLRVGTSGDYAPFSQSVAGTTAYRGFDIAVAEAFARDRGYRLEWVQFVWPELAANMKSRRFDLAMSGITVRADRSALGRFSVPVMTSGAVLLYRSTILDDATGAAFTGGREVGLARFDRPEIRIAVNRGGHLERVARSRFERATVRSIADNAAVRQALIDGSADAIVTDTLEAPGWRKGLSGIAQFGPLTKDRKAYWVAPDRERLSRELDQWLLAREADGTLSSLRRAAFGNREHEQTARPVDALLAAIDERLALMPWVAETKRRAGAAIEDPVREVRVLQAGERAVDAAAEREGVSAPPKAAVGAFYRAQIEAAKAIQRRTLRGAVVRPAEASELTQILRPALIRIGDRMAQLIVTLYRAPRSLDSEVELEQKIERALRAQELDPKSLEEIRRTLVALMADAAG